MAVDGHGSAIVVWQQFEGGHPGDGSRSNIALARFDDATGTWSPAVLAETQAGDATGPRVSESRGQALVGWIQFEGGVWRVKATVVPMHDASSARSPT